MPLRPTRDQEEDHRRVRHHRGRHRLARGPGRAADPPHHAPDRAPQGSTSTTTTAVAACCSWSASAVACCNYLQKTDIERYRSLIERLGLRR